MVIDTLISTVLSRELDELFSQAAKTGAIDKTVIIRAGRLPQNSCSGSAKYTNGERPRSWNYCFIGRLSQVRIGLAHEATSLTRPLENHLVELSDGSKWRLFPGDMDLTLNWKPDTELKLVRIDDEASSHSLVSLSTIPS